MPASTSAERQKAYRARKRAELGEAKFLEIQRSKRKERRDRTRIPQFKEINKDTVNELTRNMKELVLKMADDNKNITLEQKKDKLERKIINVKKILTCGDLKTRLINSGISDKSALSYLKKTGRVYELMKGKKWNCKDIEWLQDYKRVIDFINNGDVPTWKTKSTRSTHMNHISALVMRIPSLKDVAPFYDAEKTKKNTEANEARLEQELKPEWKALILPWKTLVAINKTVNFKTDYDEAVYGIFTLIPPRRSGSYYDLQIQPVGFQSLTKNYITVDEKTRMPKELVLNRYKTSKHYNEYRIKIPVALARKLKKHISGKSMGSNVFNNQTTGKPYTEQRSFNQATTNVFAKYTGKKIGSTLLRISYASYIVFGQKRKPSLATQNKHAKKLGHSLSVFQTYARFGVE